MNIKIIGTLFCCVLLSSKTDVYALSHQSSIKLNKADASSQVLVATNHPRHGTLVQNNKITKDRPFMKSQPPQMTNVNATLKPKVHAIKEVNFMYQRLTKGNTNDPNNDKEQQLLKHINRQIQTRQMQPEQRQRHTQNVPGQTKHAIRGRNVQQVFIPKQAYAATRSNSDQNHKALQNLSQQRVVQRRVWHSINPQKKPPQLFGMNGQVKLKTQANKNLLHQSSQQQNNIVSPNQIKLPHGTRQVAYTPNFIRRGPLIMNSHQLNGPLVQQVPSQHTNILIPVSALSLNHVLRSQGLLKDKTHLVNPLFSENALHVVSNKEKSRTASTTHLPKPLPTTTLTTTPSTTTTTLPPTTISTPPPAINGVSKYITDWNMKILKQELMEITMKKQKLEIIKLRLEIRALQREERKSLPEVEDDDAPQQRGKSWQRRSMFPFFG